MEVDPHVGLNETWSDELYEWWASLRLPWICTPTSHLQKVNATTKLNGMVLDIDKIHKNFKD